MNVLFRVSVRNSSSASSSTWWASAHEETGNLRRAHSAGPLPAHRRYAHQLLQEQRVSTTHTHTHTRRWTPFLTLSCFCRSSELIQRALMDNDFMKHLEHGQVMTPLSSSSVSYVWFKKKRNTLICRLMCADPHHHGLYASHQLNQGLLCHPGGRRRLHGLRSGG